MIRKRRPPYPSNPEDFCGAGAVKPKRNAAAALRLMFLGRRSPASRFPRCRLTNANVSDTDLGMGAQLQGTATE